MKINTYCKEIDLDYFMQIQFDPEQSMITFIGVQQTEKLYFRSTKAAFEFYFEVIEAMYAGGKEVDMDYVHVAYGHISIVELKEIIRKRIKERKQDEE